MDLAAQLAELALTIDVSTSREEAYRAVERFLESAAVKQDGASISVISEQFVPSGNGGACATGVEFVDRQFALARCSGVDCGGLQSLGP
jgi:hypothetical protein